ncbi:hypothetical protein [uncultured Microbacterium sp.]|uniref:hypothetical protein n=1 Tax=uncultured Microbacterium sp. TaxID=191216 RepID=UPI0025F219CF|nr:hypothetical protein [uncultured Microbacterium sp.]
MNEEVKATSQQVMRELLAALKIERVISIDDYNADLDESLQVEDPTEVTRELVTSDSLREALVEILTNVDAQLGFDSVDSSDDLVLAEYLDDNWFVFPRSVRLKLVQAARTHRDGRAEAVLDQEIADDVRAPELLREFLDGSVELKQYSLEEWRAASAQEMSDTRPVLVLIDRNFTRETGGASDTGEQLLADFLDAERPHIHAGLLTREARDDDAERDLTRALRAKFESSAHRVLAIGKFRLQDPSQFPAAVRTLLLVAEVSAYRELAKAALESAHMNVVEHFETLEDHSLLGAIAMAQKEGTFELEHPLRLAQRRFQQELAGAVRTPEAAALLPKLREGGVAQYIKSGEPGRQVRTLQHADIFEPSSTFNDLGLPVEVGDIFKRTWQPQGADSGSSEKLYVLLAQACDLSLRKDGSRGSVVELVLHPVEILSEAIFAKHEGKRRLYHPLGHLNQDDDVWGVKFTDSIVVPTEAIDATVFRRDGKALLTVAAPDERPMAGSWVRRQEWLLDWARKSLIQYATAEKHLKDVTNAQDHLNRLAASYGLGSTQKSRGVSVRLDTAAQTLEFGLQRVARIRADVAVNVASLTMSYAARPAFETPSVTITP